MLVSPSSHKRRPLHPELRLSRLFLVGFAGHDSSSLTLKPSHLCVSLNPNPPPASQVDVPEQAVIPDFADAALMHRGRVELLNREVIARGSNKVEQMREISASKRSLALTQWENESLELSAEHTTQHISELQLLHVSREIQVGPGVGGGRGEGEGREGRAGEAKRL